MRRSKRKSEIRNERNTRQTRRPICDNNSNNASSLPGISIQNEEEPESLFHHCLRQMMPHIWYKIIPSSPSDTEDMSFACGQNWNLLLLLLLRIKYLFKYKNSIRIRLFKFEALEQIDSTFLDVHIGSAEPHNSVKTYYICSKQPYYTNPTLQNRNKYTFSKWRYFDRNDII